MSIIFVIIIAIALSMDAFGVSLSIGVNNGVNRRQKILYLLSFGFFQFLCTFIGGELGYFCNTYIVSLSNFIGGIIIGVVGLLMIIDSLKKKEETVLAKKSMALILGISVSIDAMVVGFTIFKDISSPIILFVDSFLVGLITLFACTVAFYICRYIKKIEFVKSYADLFGGVALILFSIKMLFF